MNKLPFVWELEQDGVVSHAIGSPGAHAMPSPEHYTQDIMRYLDDKHLVLVESAVPYGGTLEAAVADITRAMELPLKCVSPNHEATKFHLYYERRINTREAAEAYKKGDLEEMRKFYGEPMSQHKAINHNIAERSARLFKVVPSLLVVNLAHFIIEPTLLKMYEEREIKIKRVQ